jgi:hypothetical protein
MFWSNRECNSDEIVIQMMLHSDDVAIQRMLQFRGCCNSEDVAIQIQGISETFPEQTDYLTCITQMIVFLSNLR